METKQQFLEEINKVKGSKRDYLNKLFQYVLEAVIRAAVHKNVKKDEFIIRAGEPCDTVYIILKGDVAGVDYQKLGKVYYFMDFAKMYIVGDFEIFSEDTNYNVSSCASKDSLENSKKFFAKYNKLKRTYEALSELVVETKADLDHLDSISTALSLSEDEKDLQLIKDELSDYGYIKSHGKKKGKKQAKSKPLHFVSSDGFHMYVGKNNYQNDELSFKFANGGDWWFHAKNMAGSHVIVRKEQAETLPDATCEEAGRLAAYYSKGRQAPKVEIDYVQRKELRKPPKAKPGFVIYHTNYSMMCVPNIDGIEVVE